MKILFDIKERLHYILIAGVKLIDEDFRLKKATEELFPLSQKNQIFNKIYVDLKTLFEAEKEQRPTIILNIVALVDAVIYTQAQTDVETSNAQPFEINGQLEKIEQFRYSELEPLIKTFAAKGLSRDKALQDICYKNRDIFKNYKALNLLINALDEGNSPFVDIAIRIIKSIGTGKLNDNFYYNSKRYDFIPPKFEKDTLVNMLKRDFNLKSEKSMIRRLKLIGEIAREKENKFYLSVLQEGKANKVIKEAILNLRYSDENDCILKDIIENKPALGRKAAYTALAEYGYKANEKFWQEKIAKNIDVITYLENENDEELADIIVTKLHSKFIKKIKSNKIQYKDIEVLYALNTKCTEKVISFYDDIWKTYATLRDEGTYEKDSHFTFFRYRVFDTMEYSIHSILVVSLDDRIVKYLNDISKNLNYVFKNTIKKGSNIAVCCLSADLLTLPSQQVYDKWIKNNPKEKSFLINGLQKIVFLNKNRTNNMFACKSGNSRELFEPLCVDFLIELVKNDFVWIAEFCECKPLDERRQVLKVYEQRYENKFRDLKDIYRPEFRRRVAIYFKMLYVCEMDCSRFILNFYEKVYDLQNSCSYVIHDISNIFEMVRNYIDEDILKKEANLVLDYFKDSLQYNYFKRVFYEDLNLLEEETIYL